MLAHPPLALLARLLPCVPAHLSLSALALLARRLLGCDRKLLEHEAQLLETLSHPNVAICLGSFVDAGSLYMVLEIADKGDLGEEQMEAYDW